MVKAERTRLTAVSLLIAVVLVALVRSAGSATTVPDNALVGRRYAAPVAHSAGAHPFAVPGVRAGLVRAGLVRAHGPLVATAETGVAEVARVLGIARPAGPGGPDAVVLRWAHARAPPAVHR
jgi:hypothetical protein